jgi:hypothetical protein
MNPVLSAEACPGFMSARSPILEWTGHGSIRDGRAAVEVGGALPGADDW